MPEENAQQVQQQGPPAEAQNNDVLGQIVDHIHEAESILIALNKNPTIDELAAAIGLTQVIDKMGKHATAIFSGKVPAKLKFLNPQNTFEDDTSSLQDFIISLVKDKADHLRYKIDGDYVKIFITPYRTHISKDDLEYSYGDYNVDLVIAVNVAEAAQLDGALVEYGRILHGASVVNITTDLPGKMGEVEWSDPAASSVCEMMVTLVNKLGDSSKLLDKDDATALLTGIIATTERFSNDKVTPETMMMSSELMKVGADQREIVTNINVEDEPGPDGNLAVDVHADAVAPVVPEVPVEPEDPTSLSIPRSGEVSRPPVVDESSVKPLPEMMLEDDEDTGPSESEQQLQKLVETAGTTEDVPGPLMAELADAMPVAEPYVPTDTDFAKQMESELNNWVEGDEPAEEPVASTEVAPEPELADSLMSTEPSTESSEEAFGGIPTGAEAGFQQGADDEDYVINKPQTVIQPLADSEPFAPLINSDGIGLPPVAPLSEVSDAVMGAAPVYDPNMIPMTPPAAPIFSGMELGDTDGILPPPPPPPVPDVGAFQLPEM
jgi:hypothetical protein